MAQSRTQSRRDDRPTSPRELGALIRAALVVCVALIAVVGMEWVGLVGGLDDGLRGRWVGLGEAAGGRPTLSKVILVSADRETIEAWGPPPWGPDKLDLLLDQVDGTGAVLVAEAGHTHMFTPGAELEAVAARHETKVLLTRTGSRDTATRSIWAGVGLERGDMILGSDSRLHLIARTADLQPLADRLPINWLVPASRLPVVSAASVAANDNLRSSFSGRIVLFGITDPEYEMLVDTTIGRLSPAEVEAHALTGLADEQVWVDLPLVPGYFMCAVLGAFLLWSFVRLPGAKATVLVVVVATLVLVIDFTCYHRGWVRVGSARALLTVGAVGLGYWIHEALETFSGLRKLRTRVLREAGNESVSLDDDEEGFWRDLAGLGAEYARETLAADAKATIIERGVDSWRLIVHASSLDLDRDSHQFLVKRDGLDVRRAPFRTPWLTLRAGWATDLLPAGPQFGRRKTLIIPLQDQSELLGMWLVHVEESLVVDKENFDTFERLGRQMADALVRRRERMALHEQASHSRLRDHIDTIVGGLSLMRDEHRWALELLEQLPVRALIATVWGEIEFVDPRLQAALERRYPGLFSADRPEENLRVILSRLTGQTLEEANRLMRKVVTDGVEIELDAKTGIEDPGDDVWVLSRIRSKRGIELPGFKPAVHEHILLMARSSAPAQTVRTRSGKLLRLLRGGSGEP